MYQKRITKKSLLAELTGDALELAKGAVSIEEKKHLGLLMRRDRNKALNELLEKVEIINNMIELNEWQPSSLEDLYILIDKAYRNDLARREDLNKKPGHSFTLAFKDGKKIRVNIDKTMGTGELVIRLG